MLTDRGEKLCMTAAAEIAKVEADGRAHLGDKAYAALRAALTSLREVTDPYRPRSRAAAEIGCQRVSTAGRQVAWCRRTPTPA